MTMPSYATSTDIRAPAERVWRLLSAVESWPRWLPTVARVDVLDGTPVEVGRRYRIEQPKLRPAVWTVTALEPGRRFTWRARSPGMTMVADHLVEPLGTDAVRVHLSFAFEGLLGALLGRLFGRLTREYLAQEAAALKQQMQTDGSAP
jgi:uncharacterized membrane protein